MKKLLTYLFVFLCANLYALGNDSISTVYQDGEFVTQYQLRLKVSTKVSAEVTDYFVNDFHNSPGNLFNWALKDLGLQNKNNELIIIFKSSVNDDKTKITHGVFDIVVPGVITFNGIKVAALVFKNKNISGIQKISANIIYSDLLLKNATGIITIIPQSNNEQLLTTYVKIKFGWFFNLFITKKRYKSIVEWRIKKFTENIRVECIKRQNTVPNKLIQPQKQ
ncbi:MAG: hypothetical protein WCK78_06255 [Paludibacter sp.]